MARAVGVAVNEGEVFIGNLATWVLAFDKMSSAIFVKALLGPLNFEQLALIKAMSSINASAEMYLFDLTLCLMSCKVMGVAITFV